MFSMESSTDAANIRNVRERDEFNNKKSSVRIYLGKMDNILRSMISTKSVYT